jgi:hypothetical protein
MDHNMKQEYKSSANLGQLNLSILNSWYVTNGIFNSILDFVQSNQSYDFNLQSDLQWHHILRFSDEQIKSAISKRGNTTKNKDKFISCVKRAREWNLPEGTRITMNPNQFERLNQAFKNENEKSNEISIDYDKEQAVYLPLRDILLVEKLLVESGHPDSNRIIKRMAENVRQLNRQILIEEEFDIDWVENDGGFFFVFHESVSSKRMAFKRWDAKYKGFDITLIRESMKESYTAYLSFDDAPIEIIRQSESISSANNKIDAYIKHEQNKAIALPDYS